MFAELMEWSQLHTSSKLLWVTDLFCALGILFGLLSIVVHARAARSSDEQATGGFLTRLHVPLTYAATLVMSAWVYFRWIEVNHFPSQTMNEVLCMFTLALLFSQVVLHHALALHKRSPGWAILDDAMHILVFLGVFFTHVHLRTLVTAQKDLPPALQSYWFPPHLSALIFSYATLGIAGLICLVYFCTRFWTAIFRRNVGEGRTLALISVVAFALLFAGLRGQVAPWAAIWLPMALATIGVLVVPRMFGGAVSRSEALIFLGLTVVPFAQIVTLPVLGLTGLVFCFRGVINRLPDTARLAAMEKDLDQVSFRAFAVGIPFLTAGLFMGAFWAQEAWANYWGWDSKENSALISWLIYVIYIHLRMLGGYRGEKAMAVLMGGALSIFITFQVFGYLPDSQKSLHRYTDDGVAPQEGMLGGSLEDQQAQAPK